MPRKILTKMKKSDTVNRVNAIRIYIIIGVLVNLIGSILRPEYVDAYSNAGFNLLALLLLTFI